MKATTIDRATGMQTTEVLRFAREPSGWGTVPDQRVLFEVVGGDYLPLTSAIRVQDVPRKLRRLAGAVRQLR